MNGKVLSKELLEKLKELPLRPGVYRMWDEAGQILYIGKSKELRSRVRSYFHEGQQWEKVKRLVLHLRDLDYIVTDTHLEAQLLECCLIKKLKPLYNAQFKNHQRYGYLKVGDNWRRPPLELVAEPEGENCFGPYRGKSSLVEGIRRLENFYPLRPNGNGSYDFTYSPLPHSLTREEFALNRSCLLEVFSSRQTMTRWVQGFEEKMEQAAASYRFEQAVVYRDMLERLRYLAKGHQEGASGQAKRGVLLAVVMEPGIKLFFISNYRVVLKQKCLALDASFLKAFLERASMLNLRYPDKREAKRQLDFRQILDREIGFGGHFCFSLPENWEEQGEALISQVLAGFKQPPITRKETDSHV